MGSQQTHDIEHEEGTSGECDFWIVRHGERIDEVEHMWYNNKTYINSISGRNYLLLLKIQTGK